MNKNVLILERSSQNLQKISEKGKVILEGIFAEFGVENRNGRLYTEAAYLPHLEYVKQDIAAGNMLGELDHPERFEVALGNVSHRIIDIWYDQTNRQVKGRIEVLNTPKGQIAKSLLEAGVPLSISSRAAGTVNDDKTVDIQQIYTYDLVAKPGFENAQLHTINESAKTRIEGLVSKLNESYSTHEKDNISQELGILNENISIIDLSDKYPSLNIREEALNINNTVNKNNKNNKNNNMENTGKMNEDLLQKWTLKFKNELSILNDKISAIENAVLEGNTNNTSTKEIKIIKEYIEKLRLIQENSLDWQSDIAKSVNKLASFADNLSHKSEEHYNLTQKIVETVDHNAQTLNNTQDWTSSIAKTTNAIAETVDHNAQMLNGINEWNEEISRGVNALNEWGEEKAKVINKLANYTEDMIGRSMSKDDGKKLVEYVEIVAESKTNPKLKKSINEILSKHGITGKTINENIKGISTITDVKTINTMTPDNKDKDNGVYMDDKTHTIISKLKDVKFKKGQRPTELKTLDDTDDNAPKITSTKVKGIMTLDITKGVKTPTIKIIASKPNINKQNLKLDVKPTGKLKENLNTPIKNKFDKSITIKERSSKLDEKLEKIVNNLEKEKVLIEQAQSDFPFLRLLSVNETKKFMDLSQTEKEKVVNEVIKTPSNDPQIIVKLWESALQQQANETPLWLKAAPKAYKEAYDKANNQLKESIIARSEYYDLKSQYQINNFWETSGLISKPNITLNESITAKTPEESNSHYDKFVNAIGEKLKMYNS